jgi:acyl dehydratase
MLFSRTFDVEDQARFAALSGDRNPIHMDSVVARRTQAGAPVVHGMHILLWLLESLAESDIDLRKMVALKVRFRGMVYLGDRVDASLTQLTTDAMRAQVSVNGVIVVIFAATLGSACAASMSSVASIKNSLPRLTSPCELTMDELSDRSGCISFACEAAAFGATFPRAAKLLGECRIAALGCSTYLVGMVVPGLHSIYGGCNLQLIADPHPTGELHYAVTSVDTRFRRVFLHVNGGGLIGSIEAFSRIPPVQQPSIESVASLVDRREFSSSVAMIVGGSRGLGEVVAKLIAAGGGRVIITYASGLMDAQKVAAEINNWGGRCEVAAYDVRRDAYQQLQELSAVATHYYYFATPPIFKRKTGFCALERLDEFNRFYIHGLLGLVEAARRLRSDDITVFYPSTAYVHDRPADMTEYAMSKAAGEILCADIGRFMHGVRMVVQRLPRLRTDQTSSLIRSESENPLEVMLPIIRKTHQPITEEENTSTVVP